MFEQLLRRIARRCEIHDRPSYSIIRQLEIEAGMRPSASSGDIVADYVNWRLIDCNHSWCGTQSGRR
ncbi:hypothetical protein ACFUEN_28930 [Streptomyces griseorubiginosus]|uniref:hypothetical protein n=1 Tax=Streptomyces griseorubiginosus TaxID=67304 RepID=UPI00363F7F01